LVAKGKEDRKGGRKERWRVERKMGERRKHHLSRNKFLVTTLKQIIV